MHSEKNKNKKDNNNSIINFTDISVDYGGEKILDSFSLSVKDGEMLAIAGPNGSGKSTILKAIMKIITPSSGVISFADEVNQLSDISYLPQINNVDRMFPLRVVDVTASGLCHKYGFWRKIKERDKIIRVLENVGLGGFVDSPIHSLSGGQFQRMLFARMLLQDAKIILLDEPFSAVDHHTTIDLIGIIDTLNSRGKTVITVMHDYSLIKKYFPTTLLMARGVVEYGNTNDVLSIENMEKIQDLSLKWERNKVSNHHIVGGFYA